MSEGKWQNVIPLQQNVEVELHDGYIHLHQQSIWFNGGIFVEIHHSNLSKLIDKLIDIEADL